MASSPGTGSPASGTTTITGCGGESDSTLPSPESESASTDDLRLLQRIGRGDREALDCFYRRWHARLRASAERLLYDAADADDAVSESMIRIQALASRGELPHQAADVPRWILGKVKTCAIRLRSPPGVPLDVIEFRLAAQPSDADAVEDADTGSRSALVRRALRRLPPMNREAVLLHYLEGRSYQEIAEIQGGKWQGANSRVERALQQLVTIIFAGQRAIDVSELTSEQRAHVLDVVARARMRHPKIGIRGLVNEVCRETGILIPQQSSAIALLGYTPPVRLP